MHQPRQQSWPAPRKQTCVCFALPQLVAHGSLSLLCHAILTCGSNGLVFGSHSDHCLCSHLLLPNQAGLGGHIHALWNSPGNNLGEWHCFPSLLGWRAASQAFLCRQPATSYQESIFQLPGLSVGSLQGDRFLYLTFSVCIHAMNTLRWIIFVSQLFSPFCISVQVVKAIETTYSTLDAFLTLLAKTGHCIPCPISVEVFQVKQRVELLWGGAGRRGETPVS